MDNVAKYLNLFQVAKSIGESLYRIVKAYAKRDLDDAEYAQLQADWDALVARTGKNAGLPDEPPEE